MKRWPAVVAIAMLVGAWGLLLSLSHNEEAALPRKSFSELPMTLANRWQGNELRLDQAVLDVLKLSDYTMRDYVSQSDSGHKNIPISLYIGYYQSQRTGATYHSPKNCLPGAGWQFVQSEQVNLLVPGRGSIVVNNVLIQKGLEKQVILYWYQDRGRIIASEYSAKAYMIWDAMTRNRTDGSLVRISVPVERSAEEAFAVAVEFLNDIFPLLSGYLPT